MVSAQFSFLGALPGDQIFDFLLVFKALCVCTFAVSCVEALGAHEGGHVGRSTGRRFSIQKRRPVDLGRTLGGHVGGGQPPA